MQREDEKDVRKDVRRRRKEKKEKKRKEKRREEKRREEKRREEKRREEKRERRRGAAERQDTWVERRFRKKETAIIAVTNNSLTAICFPIKLGRNVRIHRKSVCKDNSNSHTAPNVLVYL